MYKRFHDRFGTAGVVIGVIALIAALGGTALAAGGLTGKQKKEVKAIAKSFQGTGPAGATGTNGTNGTNGKDGANGAPGEKGKDGTNGKSVTVTKIDPEEEECEEQGGAIVEEEGAGPGIEVCNGEEGLQGAPGSPWTAGGTLPSGSTETGSWAFGTVSVAAKPEGTSTPLFVPISFMVPLAADLTGALQAENSQVHFINAAGKELTLIEGEIEPPHCHGTAAAPAADAGNLCIYAGELSGATTNQARIKKTANNEGGASTAGAAVGFTNVEGGAAGRGTWAVMAP